MKQKIGMYFAAVVLGSGMFAAFPEAVWAEEMQTEQTVSDQVATPDEMAAREEVGSDDMVPVSGSEVKDGTYEIEVESSSSMFRIVKAELTVENGNMTAILTLGGQGYLKLFMGTGEEAVAADESQYIGYVEDAEGRYTYTVSVEALNKELDCTAFSKRKEKWYDHTILFDAATLPEGALLVELPQETTEEPQESEESELQGTLSGTEQEVLTEVVDSAETDLSDGTYTVDVDLAGGSGKASVSSPAKLVVKDKKATATIEWSSPNYDYMKIGSVTYNPVNTEGNSTFEIPVMVWDKEMAVLADTTAMSMPHEISYTLTFHSDSVKKEGIKPVIIVVVFVLCFAVGAGIGFTIWKRKKKIR